MARWLCLLFFVPTGAMTPASKDASRVGDQATARTKVGSMNNR